MQYPMRTGHMRNFRMWPVRMGYCKFSGMDEAIAGDETRTVCAFDLYGSAYRTVYVRIM